jgi:hypothetical protein
MAAEHGSGDTAWGYPAIIPRMIGAISETR